MRETNISSSQYDEIPNRINNIIDGNNRGDGSMSQHNFDKYLYSKRYKIDYDKDEL